MDASLLERFGASDAHCHPQDDPDDCAAKIRSLSARHVAVMGTRLEDWGTVEELCRQEPDKVIPCFGVHPWFAHLHALEARPSAPASASSASASSSSSSASAVPASALASMPASSPSSHRPVGPSSPPASAPPSSGDLSPAGPMPAPSISTAGTATTATTATAATTATICTAAAGHNPANPATTTTTTPALASSLLDPASLLDAPSNGKDHPSRHPDLMASLRPAPLECWLPRLRELLVRHPHAVVGEFGLDRAAVVRGTKLQPSWSHQIALTDLHLRLAAELGRPVSLHCVQGYGQLQEMLRRLGPEGCPPQIMLHSYGGSVDLVKGFTKLPGGVGDRIYFSFSTVINGRARDKLLDRIHAVPLERLLVESDQNSPRGIDSGLMEILQVVAEARGISMEAAAEATTENFRRFYSNSLAKMAEGAWHERGGGG